MSNCPYALLPREYHYWKHFWNIFLRTASVLTLPYTNQWKLLAKPGAFESWAITSKLPKAFGTKTNEDGWWRSWGSRLESEARCDWDIKRLLFSSVASNLCLKSGPNGEFTTCFEQRHMKSFLDCLLWLRKIIHKYWQHIHYSLWFSVLS